MTVFDVTVRCVRGSVVDEVVCRVRVKALVLGIAAFTSVVRI